MKQQVLDYLHHVPTFSKFSEEKLERVFDNLDLQDWTAGETVFKKGEARSHTSRLSGPA